MRQNLCSIVLAIAVIDLSIIVIDAARHSLRAIRRSLGLGEERGNL